MNRLFLIATGMLLVALIPVRMACAAVVYLLDSAAVEVERGLRK